MPEPKLIVFDLDFTLWDCGGTWCDCLSPPFHERDGHIFDSSRRAPIRLYQDVPEILEHLQADGHELAVASRTHAPEWARQLMEMLEIAGCFQYEEIYPGSKIAHFERIAAESGRRYEQMVFFDDEQRNIAEVGGLGVHCVQVDEGMRWPLARAAIGC